MRKQRIIFYKNVTLFFIIVLLLFSISLIYIVFLLFDFKIYQCIFESMFVKLVSYYVLMNK